MTQQIITPSTASTEAIYATLRADMLAYQRIPDGITIQMLMGGEARVYVRAAPPTVKFPYIAMRLQRQSSGAYNGYREACMLEIQCIGRPESQLVLVSQIMDVVDGLFLGYRQPNAGLMFSRERARQTIPQFSQPADKDVVGEIAQYQLILWPQVLTDLRPNPS